MQESNPKKTPQCRERREEASELPAESMGAEMTHRKKRRLSYKLSLLQIIRSQQSRH